MHLWLGGALFVLALLASWKFTGFVTRTGDRLERDRILSLARTAAATLESPRIAALQGSPADIGSAGFDGVRDELPHSLAVTIDDIIEREDGSMTDIYANIFVERDSQKAIVIGHGGSRLREVGTKSREQIEPLIGGKVFLSLRVKVAKDWQRDPKLLGRLGF